LKPLDYQGLLTGAESAPAVNVEALDEDELLAELSGAAGASDITELRHVRTSVEKRPAEEIANRQRCEDFDRFKPLFQQIQKEIDSGVRETRPFELKAEIRTGSWFIVGGQKAYVAEMGEVFTNPQGRTDARLRVIFDNGTESRMLMRSLQRALHKDEVGRRIAHRQPAIDGRFDQIGRKESQPRSGHAVAVDQRSRRAAVRAKSQKRARCSSSGLSADNRLVRTASGDY
jgi:hypothetical protein